MFNPLSETCVQATPLILAGLAVALPYQAGLFNIGGQSQFIGGAIVATYLGYGINLPVVIHVIVCVLGSFAGGAAIGWLVGELKARTGAHEVIVTIMMNYIMAYFLAYLLSYHYLMQAPGTVNPITPAIASDAHLPLLFGTHLRINAGFLIALACAAGVWWLLERTTIGFEFRSIGKNASAARVAGMNVERNWVLVMLIAGGLAGLAASTVIQGTDFTLNDQSFGTYGIDAITVALLGRGRPVGVVWAGLLFGAFHAGAPLMQAATGTPVDMVEVLEAVIVLMVAAPPLIRAIFRLRGGGGALLVLARGWRRMTTISGRVPSKLTPGVALVSASRRWLAPATFLLFGLIDIFVLGHFAHSGDATFAFSQPFAKVTVPNLSLPARVTCYVCGGISIAIAAARAFVPMGKWLRRVAMAVVSFLLVVSLLCWADAGQSTAFNMVNLLQGTLAGSIPIMLGALTGVICSRSGVINIAIEGQLLLGAFTAAIVASGTGSLWLGLISGALAGSLVGALLAAFAIGYRVDQIVLGVVINTLILGLTGYLYDGLMIPYQNTLNSPATFSAIKIPLLGDIPILGPVFFDSTIFLYLTYLAIAGVQVGLFSTRWGLRTRAIGEHPVAADTVGIRVTAMRYRNVIAAGVIAGIGGAYFTIGSVGSFGKGMSSGEGYIALAAMIFGRYNPFGAISAALLFGFATQLQSILSTLNTPIQSNLLLMAPYIVTIIVLAGLVGKVRGPKAEGIPYVKA